MSVVAVASDESEIASVEASNRRLVVQTAEYQDAEVPIDLLVSGSRLDIYPQLLRTSVLRTYSREGRLFFQAGGWIGFIPINDRVALEVKPRVPIANLERILYLSGNSSPLVLTGHLHQFSHTRAELPSSLLDVLAERLISLTETCWNEGLHAEYVPRIATTQNPRGRLLPFATIKHRIRTHDLLAIVSEKFERTHDTAPNQCIAAALDQLHAIYSGIRERAGARSMASRLGRAKNLLSGVSRSSIGRLLAHPLVRDPSLLPISRPSYPITVALAKIVISGDGINLRSTGGHVSLPPMMISMERAFEGFLRNVLARDAEDLLVQDGNLDPPLGASSKLFHSSPDSSPLKATPSTPDIVCSLKAAVDLRLVIDVKYKPDTNRDDLNQVLGYALTFRSNVVLMACPRRSASSPAGLHLLGEVGGIKVYQYFVDLGSTDLQQEERAFSATVSQLLIDAHTAA